MAVERSEGPTVSLVLGAGGARGLAHIGVIEVLLERGFRIHAIAGCSMGALIGGIYAAGKLDTYRDWVCALQRSHVLRLLDFTWGAPGLIKGERLMDILRVLVGERTIETLPIPFTAVATDLATEREVWLTRGPLFDAIRASIAIPTVFTPYMVGGRSLVDGGLLNPIPIAPTRKDMADLVIAVDVNSRPRQRVSPIVEAAATDPPDPEELAPTSYGARIAAFIDSLRKHDEEAPPAPQPGMLDLLSRSFDTMQGQLARLKLALDEPDLLISVSRETCFFYEFWRAQEMIELGRTATEEALERVPQM